MGDVMMVEAGAPTVQQIKLAYAARLPILLHGRHGVGKSEFFRAAAEDLGIQVVVCDLSLMEPPDLVGIPRVDGDGRTRYAPPAFLPARGKGLLVFEELNRAPRYMTAPCLQILTARRLNDYLLPDGWLPCAAVNDLVDGYQVEELDAALLSRFVRVKLEPSQKEWLGWARQTGVHPKVIQFVEADPNIFEDPRSNPRAWTYVARVLEAADQGRYTPDALMVAIAGLVGQVWAAAFVAYVGGASALDAENIIGAYAAHRAIVLQWRKDSRLDLQNATRVNLQRRLQRQAVFDAVVADAKAKRNVEQFIKDLAPDLRVQVGDWLDEHGLTGLKIARSRGR